MAVAVRRAARGEEAAGVRLAALFDEHAATVLGLCRAMLRDGHEAEDAAQQTFLSAHRSLLRGADPRDARAWLFAVARNECRMRLRRRQLTPVAVDGEPADTSRDPVEIAGERERVAVLKDAVSDLPGRQRQAVVLRDFYGLSYEEIATAMSVTPSVVEALLVRGRGRLRRALRAAPRFAAGALPAPATLREQLARLVPGFDGAVSEAAAGGGGAAAGGLLAKLAALPLGGKVAAGAAAVTVGVTAAPEVDRALRQPPRPQAERAARATPAGRSSTGDSGFGFRLPVSAPPREAGRQAQPPARSSGPSPAPGRVDGRSRDSRPREPVDNRGPGTASGGSGSGSPGGTSVSTPDWDEKPSGSGASGSSHSGSSKAEPAISSSGPGSGSSGPSEAVAERAPSSSGPGGPSGPGGSSPSSAPSTSGPGTSGSSGSPGGSGSSSDSAPSANSGPGSGSSGRDGGGESPTGTSITPSR